METDLQPLPNDVEVLQQLLLQARAECAVLHSTLHATNAALDAKTAALIAEQAEIERLRERLRLYLWKRFGPSSERSSKDQLQLFNEPEILSNGETEDAAHPESADAAPEAGGGEAAGSENGTPRRRRGRRPLPPWMERRRVVHDLPEHEKICPQDGTPLEQIGEESSEQLEYIRATVRVIQNVRPKYACPRCENGVRIAPLPPQPIPKSMASPSLLAQIAVAKYCDALPLYRQEAIWERVEVELSRTTMANWMIALGRLVQPVINLLNDDLLAYDIVHCDETRVQVLKENGKTAQSQSFLWGRLGGPGERPILLFDYDPTRGGEVAERLLQGFEGFVQVDGYSGYNGCFANPKVIRVGCMAHVRRKFDEALKAQAGAKQAIKGRSKAHQGMAYIQKLYRIERDIRGQDPPARKAARAMLAGPILTEMKAWLDASKGDVPPTSLVGRAISYASEQWDSLLRYLGDGRLEIDNNLMENAIRPFAIGRKNWLFSDTVHGAQASASLYSLIQTARANKLEPYGYLSHLFTQLPKATAVEDYEQLLPTRWRPEVESRTS